mmetsp:Transcript_10444/g.19040  ORF Transcript_10444/g.19040 Transcript_10444/m.19040 type:complete len:93 (-) Transcript_10444:534-812(-)
MVSAHVVRTRLAIASFIEKDVYKRFFNSSTGQFDGNKNGTETVPRSKTPNSHMERQRVTVYFHDSHSRTLLRASLRLFFELVHVCCCHGSAK